MLESTNNPNYTDDIFRSTVDIEHIIREFEPNSYLARVSLEYAVSNSKTELLEYLIEKLSSSENEVSNEWAEIYLIDNLVCKNELDLTESINKLTYIQCQSPEMSALRKIFQLYNYYDLKAFQMIEILSELIKNEIISLEDGYMKDSLQSRLDLAMQSVYLHLNQVEKSRTFGLNLKVNASTPIMQAIAYKNLALSYLFDNYDEAISQFNEALKVLEEIQNHDEIYHVQRLMNFVHTYWGHPEKTKWLKLDNLDEKQGYAYSLIKNNELELAKKTLEETEFQLEDDFHYGYHFYYLGLITDEDKYFYQSVRYFSKSGDYFFRQLPLQQLQEKGVNTVLLSALSV
ncbi:AimR family lysis-lysogeny pheromone receptor [Evansella sp. AB-P1]|uniref:AimR family lysis-lysogeny pheromone receptor n=1 Tax=Evansella sp. AB-P1 TaxID=3037653 RepID=UPI00241C7437|nr:AimR family lysis-lysogeny pheromone receptor [Evansella sp. AB-P1]MDG5787191.1 AimR family lysis-lysogeny pheromone receptor [Evansella sp. AB-P1]